MHLHSNFTEEAFYAGKGLMKTDFLFNNSKQNNEITLAASVLCNNSSRNKNYVLKVLKV